MTRCRICLWLLVTLAIPAQAMAAYAQRLPCFDPTDSAAPAVEMDCHSAGASHTSGQPDCCGDSCPDMTACAAPHAAGPSAVSQVLSDGRSAPIDRYVVPSISAQFAPPFRPPTVSHA